MILLAILTLLSLLIGIKSRYVKLDWTIYFFLSAFLIFFAWLVEFELVGNIDFFVNDELEYVEGAQSFEWSDFLKDRGLWYAINYWLLKLDIPTGVYALKLINIFFLFFLLVFLSKIYSEKLIFKSAIIFLPYLFVVALNNLRDTLILLLLTSSIYCLIKGKKLIVPGFISLGLLFFLRPIFSGIAVLICFAVLSLTSLNILFRFSVNYKILGILLLLIAIAGPFAHSKLHLALNRAAINIEGGGKRLERVMEEGYATGNRIRDLTVASARYTFAPLPSSLIQRIFSGGSEEWGIVEDIVRLWNQTGYFLLMIYIMFKWKTSISVLRKMAAFQWAVLVSLFMYMPIYSLHLYGVCHQRLKLPFQLSILIIAALVWRSSLEKKKKSRNIRHGL